MNKPIAVTYKPVQDRMDRIVTTGIVLLLVAIVVGTIVAFLRRG